MITFRFNEKNIHIILFSTLFASFVKEMKEIQRSRRLRNESPDGSGRRITRRLSAFSRNTKCAARWEKSIVAG
jgi:hypothetical protein